MRKIEMKINGRELRQIKYDSLGGTENYMHLEKQLVIFGKLSISFIIVYHYMFSLERDV